MNFFSEDHFQTLVATTLDRFSEIYNFFWAHVPNEVGYSSKNAWYMNKRKKHGVKPGFPDCVIFTKDKEVIFIELKVSMCKHIKDKKRLLSKKQRELFDLLTSYGYTYYLLVASDPVEGIKQLEKIIEAHF